MISQPNLPAAPVITMFLKPSFMMTAQGNGLQVAVTVQAPLRPEPRN